MFVRWIVGFMSRGKSRDLHSLDILFIIYCTAGIIGLHVLHGPHLSGIYLLEIVFLQFKAPTIDTKGNTPTNHREPLNPLRKQQIGALKLSSESALDLFFGCS